MIAAALLLLAAAPAQPANPAEQLVGHCREAVRQQRLGNPHWLARKQIRERTPETERRYQDFVCLIYLVGYADARQGH